MALACGIILMTSTLSLSQPRIVIKAHPGEMGVLMDLSKKIGGNVNGPYRYDNRDSCVWTIGSDALRVCLDQIIAHLPASGKKNDFIRWKQFWEAKDYDFKTNLYPLLRVEKDAESFRSKERSSVHQEGGDNQSASEDVPNKKYSSRRRARGFHSPESGDAVAGQ
jgi:hypothetical protein